MDDDQLREEAAGLIELAGQLVRIDRRNTREESEKPAQDLGHAVVRFGIGLLGLADASRQAYRAMEAMFPDEEGEAAEPPDEPVEELAGERAEYALLSAILAGDVALDAFAWAELARRKRRPRLDSRTGRMPTLWPALLRLIDDQPDDSMTKWARLLDVTLDAARDAIVAHRDPDLWALRLTGTGMAFGLELITLDEDRLRAAMGALRQISVASARGTTMPRDPADARRTYDEETERLIYLAPLMGDADRKQLRIAFRFGGMSSPRLHELAHWYARLLRIYLERRGVVHG